MLIYLVAFSLVLIAVLGSMKLYQYTEDKRSGEIWKLAEEQSKTAQAFHYQIAVMAKDGNKEKYRQSITGDWNKEGELKGKYEYISQAENNQKEFITLNNITYSLEGQPKKWFSFQPEDYPEAMGYPPHLVIKFAKESHYIKYEKGQWLFEANISHSLSLDDSPLQPAILYLDKKGVLQKAIVKGRDGKTTIIKTVLYSQYGQKVTIEKPNLEE